jgi:hypothetical protein
MVAVRLARGWVGYGGVVHRAGETVDVDPVTLARLEASGVVTPTDLPEPMPYGSEGREDDERTVAWAGPTSEPVDDPDATKAWAGPTSDDDDQDSDWAGPTAQRTV